MRGAASLAAGTLLWGIAVSPAAADQARDSQWALKSFEAETKVWPISQGEGIVVAVVDGGVSPDHQDMIDQVLPGADFSGGKTDGRDDKTGHGTGMASLIAARGHGPQAGVMGLAPKAKILPVKIRTNDESPDLQQSDIALAVRFAVDHGAKVINMSIGGFSRFDSQARAAISYAVSKDVVLVAATGNSGDKSGSVEYPAAFPGVVAAAAIDEYGKAWERSTFGPETTLAAPGVEVYQATAKSASSYGIGRGTSDATAYVSATAALIRSKYPNLSAGQVINRMIKSAAPPSDGSAVPDAHYGYGIVDPAKALAANPAVDSGPRENPLLKRVESQGAPPDAAPESTDEASEAPPGVPSAGVKGNPGITYTLIGAGVLFGLVLVAVCVSLVVRGRRKQREAAAVPGGTGYPYPVPPPPGQPGQQGYGYAPPPQQPPAPPTGNPYQ
ncbi:type VII secretion-associated serine protease mycosin [Streptomyces sp. CB01881]|uniref:type VII secretion-associated serine protease mycosin n=1 Tax=Streptomyces sp. CB01881 TaxID=2078691 RepID=UPI0023F85454|nr:type VII secretion-associated serine protease mycosin [Streptomyces sp. CB01881]